VALFEHLVDVGGLDEAVDVVGVVAEAIGLVDLFFQLLQSLVLIQSRFKQNLRFFILARCKVLSCRPLNLKHFLSYRV